MVSLEIVFLLIMINTRCYECLNTWNKTIASNGENIWKSTSSFIPTQSKSYGSIRLGEIITVEFDFIFKGRTNNPRRSYSENFFRIGHNAKKGASCDGNGSRYPSIWLTSGDTNTGYLDISTTSGIVCAPKYALHEYGTINLDSLHHIKIKLIPTELTVHISGGNKPNYTQTFSRQPILKRYMNQEVPIWFMSNRFTGTPYNIGNGILSNIIITSNVFTTLTANPTATPTFQPTQPTLQNIEPILYPTNISPTTENPTLSPTISPFKHDSLNMSPTTENPTLVPTINPTVNPIINPTMNPITDFKVNPTKDPTTKPTHLPVYMSDYMSHPTTEKPTKNPTLRPTTQMVNNSNLPPIQIHPSNSPTNSFSIKQSDINSTIEMTHMDKYDSYIKNKWTTVMVTIAGFALFWIILVLYCVRRIKKSQMKHGI